MKIAEKESEVRNAKRTATALENVVRQRQAEWTEATEECEVGFENRGVVTEVCWLDDREAVLA